jgi:hypothetical protein
MAVGA